MENCQLLREFSFGYLMNRGTIKSSRKFKKRRRLGGEDSEFCVGYVEFVIPVLYPGVGVQKAIGNNEKSGMVVNIWELLIQGCIFQNT